MISWTTLEQVLLPLTKRSPLQQGWSPQCESQPAEPEAWGVLKTTAIQAGHFLEEANKRLPDKLEPRPALEVLPGDLLITCAGPRARCGVPTLVRWTRPRLMLSGKMYRFRTNPDVDPRFLEYYLLSHEAQQLIDDMKTGISESGLNLTKDRFLGLAVPVAPLNEQRRIVEMLEDYLSRLDAAEVSLKHARTRADRMVASAQDALVWAGDIETVSVGDLLRERMRNGHSARAVQGDEHGIRTLTLSAVTRASFTNEYTKITTANPGRVEGLWLKSGDIFVERSNTPELVGTTAIYLGPDDWAIFPDLLIRLRVDESRVRPRYAALALGTERSHRLLRGRAKGLSGSMPKVDQAAISETRIPVPSLEEQDRVLREVDSIRDSTSALSHEVERAARRSRGLRRALLTAAFGGRLAGSESDLERVEEMAGV